MSKRESKKEHILQAGLEIMKQHGYNGTSVKDIVDAAGVPKGSFYNYFDSKEIFAIEALEAEGNKSYGTIQNILSDKRITPMQRLQNFFELIIQNSCEGEFKVGCFFGNMCQEMSDNSEVIRSKVKYGLNHQTQMIKEVLDEANEAGEISCDCDTEIIAEFILNAWEGALMRMKASKTREPLDAFLNMLPHIIS